MGSILVHFWPCNIVSPLVWLWIQWRAEWRLFTEQPWKANSVVVSFPINDIMCFIFSCRLVWTATNVYYVIPQNGYICNLAPTLFILVIGVDCVIVKSTSSHKEETSVNCKRMFSFSVLVLWCDIANVLTCATLLFLLSVKSYC